jgi:hypothetical protein
VLLALGVAAIATLVLLWVLLLPKLQATGLPKLRAVVSHVGRAPMRRLGEVDFDRGRELRAEQRARALLRSCVNEEDWAMYHDLGFLRVWGASHGAGASDRAAYLIYPHRPIVAYLPQTGLLLGEYCVAFPDHTRPFGSSQLPDSDDVLAKWMALTADERSLISDANMHLPGRQVDVELVRSDLARLARWERERFAHERGGADSVPRRERSSLRPEAPQPRAH